MEFARPRGSPLADVYEAKGDAEAAQNDNVTNVTRFRQRIEIIGADRTQDAVVVDSHSSNFLEEMKWPQP
jgi:hypothetical protein